MAETHISSADNRGQALAWPLVILLVVGVALGIWWWQQQQVTSSRQEITKLQEERDKLRSDAEAHQDSEQPEGFATGQVRTSGLDAVVEVLIETSKINLDEIWVEYGKAPNSLDQSSERSSEGIDMGAPNVYGRFSIRLDDEDLDNGEIYFYRAAGKTEDGKTVYGGIAAFQAPK